VSKKPATNVPEYIKRIRRQKDSLIESGKEDSIVKIVKGKKSKLKKATVFKKTFLRGYKEVA